MDRVQLGQTDVGSYVFTLLLPLDEPLLANLPQERQDQDDVVAATLQKGLELAAEMAQTHRVPSQDRIREAGVTANFCESLYDIVDWSENVSIELWTSDKSVHSKQSSYEFGPNVLSVLERTKQRLAPDEEPKRRTLIGTVTRVSEPQIKRRGSLDLRVRFDGRYRTIRIPFDFEDRDTVIAAFKEKASKSLSVTGSLRTGRNGRLTIENPTDIDVTRRGSLL